MPQLFDSGPAPAPSGDAEPTEDRIVHVDHHTNGTLPSLMTLALAQSSLPQHQLSSAAALLAQAFDLPPAWFFGERPVGDPRTIGVTLGTPLRRFADPGSGGEVSLATARRLLHAHEDTVIERMLREALVQPLPVARPVTGRSADPVTYDTVSPKRVAQVVRALAPLRGEDVPFNVGFAVAIGIASETTDIGAFSDNLAVTSRMEGLNPILAIEIARRGAAQGTPFRTAYDVARFVAPEASGPIGLAQKKVVPLLDPQTGRKTGGTMKVPEGELIAQAIGAEGVTSATGQSQLEASTEFGSQITAGLSTSPDFLKSLQEAQDDYVAAGQEIAARVKIPFSDSWAGHVVGAVLDYSYRPLDAISRVLFDPNVILAPFGKEETGNTTNLEEGLRDSWDILQGRTTGTEQLYRDVGIPPWLTVTAQLFAGFGEFSIDPVQQAFNLSSAARGRKLITGLTEAGRPEEWGPRVEAFLTKPVGRLGDFRGVTVGEYMIREASRVETPEKFFGRAVDNFRAYFSADGIHPIVAERIYRFVRSAKRLGLTEADLREGVDSVLLAALGVKPPPGSLAAEIATHVEELRATTATQLPLMLADGSKYEAATTRLSHDAATALGALDDAHLDLATRGPRMVEIPHTAGPITRAEHALRTSWLADTGLGRVLGQPLASPKVSGAHLELGIEQGAEVVSDFDRALGRAQVFSREERAAAKLELSNAIRPTNPVRGLATRQVLERYNTQMLDRVGAAYGMSEGQVETLLRKLTDKLGKGMADRPKVFAAFREGGSEELVRTPILPSQEMNTFQMIDPVVLRRGIAETIGTWRKWRDAQYRAFGAIPPAAREVALPLRRFMDDAADLIVRDLFLSWFKPLVVLRPAYILRVVGLEEQGRFLATLGMGRRLEAGKLLSGERIAQAFEEGTGESRLMSGARAAGRLLPEDARAALAARLREGTRGSRVSIEIPELAEFDAPTTLSFGRPGHLPDEALANTITSKFAMATPGPIERAMHEALSPNAWGAIERGSPHFQDWWFNALGHQFGLDPIGRRYLDDIARGVDEETSVARNLAYLTEPGDGIKFAKRIMGPDYTREALEIQVRRGVRYARDITREHPELAAAARDGLLEPEMLRAVPEAEQPLLVHGPMMSETVLSRVGPAKRGRDFAARWIVQESTNRLSRQPYFKAWYDRMNRALVETARASGTEITPELLQGFHDSSREFAIGQVRRIMFDFTREGRLDQVSRYFLMFVQPFLEFPVVWSRVIRQNPAALWHIVRMGRFAIQSGFLHEDPETGELSVPLSWWAGAAPLLAAVTGGQLTPAGQGGGWELSAPLTSFNLFAQSTFPIPTGGLAGEVPVFLPSLNPEVTGILQGFLNRSDLRADYKARVSSWLFAYGPIDIKHPGNLLPSYLHQGLAALFPEWFQAETDLQASHFMIVQQAMGLTPDPELARAQAQKFAGLRALFAAVFPAAPRIAFPTNELEQEWRHYIDVSDDYASARTEFLKAHPGLDLITIARTMWAEDNGSPISIPASQAVNELLNGRGAKKFAEMHPAWVWAIIPSELREGNLDPGAFFAQIGSGQRTVLSPEAFQEKGAVQQGWDAYFALREGWIAWQEAHPEIGEGDPPYDAEYADFVASRDHISETNPAWAAEYGTFELGGVEPRVMAESRRLAADPMFMKTDTGRWLVGYLAMRDRIAVEMAQAGVHSIRTVTADRLGLTGRYDKHVAALNEAFPDGATAYRLFFAHDLEHGKTPGDRALDKIPENVYNQQITPWWTQYEILRDGPNTAPTESAVGEAFNAIRAYVELGYQQFPKGQNPLILRWNTADPTYQQDAMVSLIDRFYPYLTRFDKTYLLGDHTSKKVEELWTTYVTGRAVIAQKEAIDPAYSSTAGYETLGKWVAAQALANPLFASQLVAANEWGYGMRRIIADPKLSATLFGTEPKYAKPYWTAFLDAVGEVQRVVDTGKLGGSYDPKAKVAYNLLRGNLLGYVDTLKESSVEFKQQWDFLEDASGSDPLIGYFMPEFNSYFGPIQGYPGD